MPGTGDALTKITELNKRLVLPLFEEIQGSRRMAAKNRVIRIAEGFSTGHPVADDALLDLHATRRALPDLAATPAHERQGERVGHTLILVEPQGMRIDQRHTLAGYSSPASSSGSSRGSASSPRPGCSTGCASTTGCTRSSTATKRTSPRARSRISRASTCSITR